LVARDLSAAFISVTSPTTTVGQTRRHTRFQSHPVTDEYQRSFDLHSEGGFRIVSIIEKVPGPDVSAPGFSEPAHLGTTSKSGPVPEQAARFGDRDGGRVVGM
jgi:hypothetical protein